MERMKKRKCPYCRTIIQGETVNVPLQQLVSRMQTPQARSTASTISSPQEDPEASAPSMYEPNLSDDCISVITPNILCLYDSPAQSGDDMGQKYLDEFRNSSMRCRALQLQLHDVSQVDKFSNTYHLQHCCLIFIFSKKFSTE